MKIPADGLYLGLMSGTSVDAIDAALIRMAHGRPELVAAHAHPWPEELRRRLLALRARPRLALETLGRLDTHCGEILADAALTLLDQAGIAPDQVRAIGSHGQTLYHHPEPPAPHTLQIGNPALIAERTGITTVADFRRRDLAAGGQGAPLVPLFHREVLHHPRRHRAVLNIGGIANLTLLPPEGAATGFDTGPGNCLMDDWIRHCRQQPLDRDGLWAASAPPDPALLAALLADPFFHQPPPKSTGTEHFSLQWLQARLEGHPLPEARVQATLLTLTVESIARAVEQWAAQTEEVLVCGGGRHNRTLMEALARALAPVAVRGTDEEGMNPDWIEAMAFAWLAARTLSGLPGNLPAVTGARAPVVLGGIYPGATGHP